MKTLNVWLAYVSNPVTPAAYLERALRKYHNVTTIGPMIEQDLIEEWDLENMKVALEPHDIPAGATPDVFKMYQTHEEKSRPDLYLWVESVFGYFPENIDKLEVPTACYLVNSHMHLEWQLEWAQNFDHVFVAQREYIPDFKKAGVISIHWLPLGCDEKINIKLSDIKKYDIGFVGSLTDNPRRNVLLKKIRRKFDLYSERCFWLDMSRVFSESKLVFNSAVRNDLNMRVFEVLAAGSFLLTDHPRNSGLEELFIDGEELGVYEDETILNTIEFYLENDELREIIAKRGREVALNSHRYEQRALELIKVALREKETTPTAKDWREKSLEALSVSLSDVNRLKRSFVIPVLGLSPASKYNIKTLLNDLERIGGNVLVIFNSAEVAEEIKNHARIDYYAIMNTNVGVARAWNIGLNMSQTPITFILNSDVYLEKECVDDIEKGLIQLDKAAMVGPEGSLFHFGAQKDLVYFDKGEFNHPVKVDAVSGFLFAVKTKYFANGTLKFENNYTPCYFEEWDVGLQIKLSGLRSYVVPSTGYDHQWSGSIGAMRTIKYMDKEHTVQEIFERNGRLFRNKWERIDQELKRLDGYDSLLVSYWAEQLLEGGEKMIKSNEIDDAEEVFMKLLNHYPELKEAYCNLGVINYHRNSMERAKEYFEKALDIDPGFETARDNLSAIKSLV